ncbi:sulfatase-like hydrolase/transferase [Martelella mediterranea]|uniref:Choline-sulfatase n=1 Tax=Martelella mediterranea DSM 17316 TaxID=1122214 RepID=A0A1U9Z9X1_9HYPH|nr:sulfatase-like hydrolase/transferase [Martelella mediterranea]AQZ54484.1 Choline-sulfatase [Martelella mediterranea DSM 17316]
MTVQPNIVLIVADDLRWESLGATGCSAVATPNIDRLAARGISFDGAHCQGGMHPAVCAPSRASLMTGRNIFASSEDPAGRDFGGRAFAIPSGMETVPERLRKAGYRTHHIGKWHNDCGSFARSFAGASRIMFGGMSNHDHVPLHAFDPTGRYPAHAARTEDGLSTDLFADAALEFLHARPADQPFFLHLAFTAPHDPRTPPPRHRVDPATVALPANYMPAHPFDNGEMLVRDELLEATPRTPDAVRRHIADYLGMVQHLDEAVGRICDRLDALGLTDDTLVIFTADHGIALGQHGLMGKQNLYEHSTRIPLIVAGPGIDPAGRSDALVWHADTAVTVLSAAGLEADGAAEGASLLPLGGGPSRETFVSVHCESQRAVRDHRWKLIRYLPNAAPKLASAPEGRTSRGSAVEQLFDLEKDPGETVNRASDPALAGIRAGLIDALLTWQERVGDPMRQAFRASFGSEG